MLSHYVDGKEPRYYKGPRAPVLNDLAYTEKVALRMTVHAPPDSPTRTAAQVLVEQLIAQGVSHVFCVPGESYLPVLDALYDSGIAGHRLPQ